MNRFNLVLTVLAALQTALLLAFVFLGDDDASTASDRGRLFEFTKADVGAVEITEGGDDGQSLRLVERDGAWVYPKGDDFQIDGEKITKIIDELLALSVARPVVRQERNLAPLHVADENFERKVVLENGDGKTLATLFVARGSTGEANYYRLGGESTAYEAEGPAPWSLRTRLSGYLPNDVLEVQEQDIQSFSMMRRDQPTLRFERRAVAVAEGETDETTGDEATSPETEWWMVAPELKRADQTAVDGLASSLTRITLDGVDGKSPPADSGLDDPRLRFVLTMKSGDDIEFAIGDAEEKARNVPLKSSLSPWYFRVQSWRFEDLKDKTAQDYLEEVEDGEAVPTIDPQDDTTTEPEDG